MINFFLTKKKSTLSKVIMMKVNSSPGPLAPPVKRRPSLNMTALSYSCTTCEYKQIQSSHEVSEKKSGPLFEFSDYMKITFIEKRYGELFETGSVLKYHIQRNNGQHLHFSTKSAIATMNYDWCEK